MYERWETIEESSDYQVSNLGRVRTIDRWKLVKNESKKRFYRSKILKFKTDKDGYKIASIRRDGKIIYAKVHRLVAKAFVDNPNNKPQVNHLDENKENNRCDNLEWVTTQENTAYGTLQERMKKNMPKKAIVGTPIGGGKKIYFESGAAARRAGFQNAHKAVTGTVKSSNGYTWEYMDKSID